MKRLIGVVAASLLVATSMIYAQTQTSGGGGGTPGGSNTQVQFNSSGAFGGSSKLTWDGTTLTNALGTITTSDPFTISQTWNAAGVTFTGVVENVTMTAQHAGSILHDWQVGGQSQFQFTASTNNTGQILVNNANCSSVVPYSFNGNTTTGMGSQGSTQLCFEVGGATIGNAFNGTYNGFGNRSDNVFAWSSSATLPAGTQGTNEDTGISRSAAATIKVGNGAQGDGTGTAIMTNVQTLPVAVGSLPTCNAGNKGMRAFVTDSNSVTFHATVANGGANNVAVVCDGTNWYID